MKFLLCTLIALMTASCGEPDGHPEVEGGMSRHLRLSVTYDLDANKAGVFSVMVENVSQQDLLLNVNLARFRGTMTIVAADGREMTLYEKEYRHLLLTSTWDEPMERLAKGGNSVWKVPLTEMCDLGGREVTADAVEGSTVTAKLDLIAVVPADKTYVSSNACQKSAPVRIVGGKSVPVTSKP